MENNSRTWNYLKEMGAVFKGSVTIVDRQSYNEKDSTVYVNQRDWYVKRNGKKCYVDHKGKRVYIDPTKVKKHRNMKVWGSNLEYNSQVTYSTNYQIDKEVIQRLKTN